MEMSRRKRKAFSFGELVLAGNARIGQMSTDMKNLVPYCTLVHNIKTNTINVIIFCSSNCVRVYYITFEHWGLGIAGGEKSQSRKNNRTPAVYCIGCVSGNENIGMVMLYL
jgi:hypothetical protein